ncbi:D-xylose ABC transporter ATP-binding protein [candidate division KSB3 bacterium]|uniref:Ribose/galactose/methyl galactoside import ATP-binding protein n=1 Tax=candidate division KSB3 bacterium TaxID=2044937 RepID=A0A2G6E6R4_9BACT|nr:MAG: D-xylose ABC transporter ATP-binding protein [candidate division KSB3 bacterium]PIE30205.1 MAG: D-xylose ABC transporter ATP-binding protein [candidate division KSB3 bacterium]
MLLQAEQICKHFGGVQALNNVKVDIHGGEVHALLGENGAGKSTLGKVIAGVHRADSGRILWNGRPVKIDSPLDAQRLGISIIFQEIDLFGNLTIEENIVLRNLRFREGSFDSRKRCADFCRPFLEKVRLGHVPGNSLLGELSTGEMQLVAIARALSFETRLIVMDESTSSLTDDAVENLFALIQDLTQHGVAIIYVSHKMDEIFRIADRVTVLRDGEYVGTKSTNDTNIDELINMMVGRYIDQSQRSTSHCSEKEVLRVSGLSTPRLNNVSFHLRQGEVLGIAGLVGAGRTEIGKALYGLDPIQKGQIHLQGQAYKPVSPRNSIEKGFGLLPEDRKLSGLMMQMGVYENMSMSSLRRYSTYGWINVASEFADCHNIAAKTMLKAASPAHTVDSLSGGNQQKVLLSRWVLVDPDIIFLDDPTRGVDVGAKGDIYSIIEGLAASGKAVIMTSSELPELLRCCDRIMVMREGRNAGIVDARNTTQEEIMVLAAARQNP